MSNAKKLCLTLKPGESFQITDSAGVEFEIRVSEVRGRNVRHQIDAPPSIRIVRDGAVVREPSQMVGRRIET